MPPSEIILDPRGDLRLKVGKESDGETDYGQVTFLTCSRALARASPVFDRMLYGNFCESRPADGSWAVTLPEDKPKAVGILLQLSHARFHEVSRALSVDEIYDLIVATNYYDCTPLVVPWMGLLMPSIDTILTTPTTSDLSIPKMLWVSWELGLKEGFEDLARKFLNESKGQWTSDEIQKEVQSPPDILERVEAIRVQTFQSLLDIFRDMVETLIVVDEQPRWCHHASWMGPHRCESMILGSITFCLARAGLWPLPDAREIEYSILGLYSKLTSLVIHDIGQTADKPLTDHSECNPRSYLLDKIRQTLNEIPSPLTKIHCQHLERQAKRLGG